MFNVIFLKNCVKVLYLMKIIEMKNYYIEIVLILVLVIDLIFSKRDFKNWNKLDQIERLYLLRPFLILVFGIIFLIMKNFKS